MDKKYKIFISGLFAVMGVFMFSSHASAIAYFNMSAEPPTCTISTQNEDGTWTNEPGVVTYHSLGEFMRCSPVGSWAARRHNVNMPIANPTNKSGETGSTDYPRNEKGMLFSDKGPTFGERNSLDTKILQSVLNRDGQNIIIDGNFGPATKTGLMRYQGKYRLLPANGVFNPTTRTFIETKYPKLVETSIVTEPTAPVTPAVNEVVSLKDASTKLEKVKLEIAKMTDMLAELSKQAMALEAFLK